MREIKFRFFYKPENKMKNLYEVLPQNKIVTWCEDGEQDWCYYSMDGSNGDAVIMQYTGLKDKKGVEIYEGDILSRESYWKSFVGYEDGAYRWIPCNFVQRANFRPLPQNILDAESLTYWEVIGNIYENPELMS